MLISPDRLATLADVHGERCEVLTACFDLDVHHFPTPAARESQLHSMRHALLASVHAGAVEGLEAGVERICDALAPYVLHPDGAQGVLVVSAPHQDVFEVVVLARSCGTHTRLNHRAHLEPCLSGLGQGRWLLVWADRRSSGLLVGDGDGLREVSRHDVNAEAVIDSGTWTAGHRQRSIEADVRAHVHATAADVDARLLALRCEHLVVCAREPMAARLCEALSSGARTRLRDVCDLSDGTRSASDLLRLAQPVIERTTHERDEQLLARYHADAGRTTHDLAQTLDALAQGRVHTLIVEADRTVEAKRCERCGMLYAAEEDVCALDGHALHVEPDVTDEAIGLALAEGAQLVRWRTSERAPSTPICALLRW